MRKTWLLILFGLLASTCAWAQSTDHMEVFGGYSFAARDFSGAFLPVGTLDRGWNAAVNLKLNRAFGFVADVGGYYNSQNSAGNCFAAVSSCTSRAYTFLFGPQFTLPFPKVTPFVHAFVGAAHNSENGTFSNFNSHNSPAFAVGGGIDYHLTRHFSLRGEGDYLLTNFTYGDNQLHFNNNNARISAGLVFHF